MALQFIFGNAGSGKSHTLYEYVIQQSIQNRDQNYLIVVPEQFTMQTQKDIVMAHPDHGILNIDVLSFGRLAHRILEELGGNRKKILNDTGKNYVLRKIATKYEGELKVLRNNLKRQGYISEVKSVLSEFAQYNITNDVLERMTEQLGEDCYLYWKLQDLAKVQAGFYEFLEQEYITNEELLDVLSHMAERSTILKNSVVLLDGFTGFTPVQMKLLKELLRLCQDVVVTVTMDKREDPYGYKHPYQLFALSKQMTVGLLALAKEVKRSVKEPIWMSDSPVYRFRQNEAMAFLEQNLFRYTRKQYEEAQEVISIHSVKTPREEAEFVMGQIRNHVRTQGYRYRDMAVITADLDTYGDIMRKMAAQYDVPVFLDQKRNVLQNAFVEYIRSFLKMLEQRFSYESVFRFLRCGMTSYSHREIDLLENYVIAFGIKGFGKWNEKWVRTYKGLSEKTLEEINAIRQSFVERMQEVVAVFQKRKKTVEEVTMALYDFLVQEEMQRRVEAMEERFQEAGQLALAKEYTQIYRIVIEMFDQLMELLGDEPVRIKEYCELLDAGFEDARVGVIPPGFDEVLVGDLERTRLKDVKVLFFVGANDCYIPGQQRGKGLLSEEDRKRFEQQEIPLAPNGKEKIYIQKFYLYLHFTKPTDKLYVSYSNVSADGKSLKPSYLIMDLQKLYPSIRVQQEENRTLSELELTRTSAISHVIEALRDKEAMNEQWMELYESYWREERWRPFLKKLVEASRYEMTADTLSQRVARDLYGEKIEGSVTRLERFSACAFAHFLTYGLRLKERKEYQFQAVDFGNLFHRAIELFSIAMVKQGLSWTTLTEEKAERLVEESVEASIVDYGDSILYSTARNEYMITRLKRMMRRTIWALSKQFAKGDFVPVGYELPFGSGKIDRVDVYETEEKVYVKVVDYKTGLKNFSLASLYYGLQLQLAVYLNAAIELEQRRQPKKKVVPAGAFYYRLQDPIVDAKADETVEDLILKELRPDGIVNADSEVIDHLDREFQGNSLVIPVGKTKSNTLSKTSKAYSEDVFETISSYVKKTISELEDRMQHGDIQISPYEMGMATGCDYCPFRGICKFDENIAGCEFRKLYKWSDEEVLKKMKESEER